MRQQLLNFIIAITALILCAACGNGGMRGCLSGDCPGSDLQSVGQAVNEPTTQTTVNPATVTCTASVSSNLVYHGEIFTLNITAAGGTSPYSVPGYISGFASTTALSGGYYNTGSTDRIVQRTVQVVDSQGRTGNCSFSVTVRSPVSSSALSCNIAVTPASPKIGQAAEFKITAAGADNITFKSFNPQPGWNASVAKTAVNQGTVLAIYHTAGTRSASAIISAGGVDAVCSAPITVRLPKMDATSSTSFAYLADAITVRASGIDFDPSVAKVYTFTTSEPGISIVANGDTATVRSADGRFHRFTVHIKISNSVGEEANFDTAELTFGSAPVLSCNIEPAASGIAADGSLAFKIRSGNTTTPNDQFEVINFDPGYGGQVISAQGMNPVIVRYIGTGYRAVSARARSAVTGTPCNDGGTFSSLVQLNSRLNRCDVVINPNPSIEGQTVTAQVNLPSGVGVGPFRIDLLADSGVLSPGATPSQQRIYFPRPGSFLVSAKVTDTDGTQVTCQATQNVSQNIQTRSLSCSSGQYRYAECYAGGTIQTAFITQKISSAGCNYGSSWGYNGSSIWVNHGCRAQFEVKIRP